MAGVRASDGLFEMIAKVREDEGVVVLGLKSIFYNGLLGAQPDEGTAGKKASGPMSPWTQWLHQHYDKVLMETAVLKITR